MKKISTAVILIFAAVVFYFFYTPSQTKNYEQTDGETTPSGQHQVAYQAQRSSSSDSSATARLQKQDSKGAKPDAKKFDQKFKERYKGDWEFEKNEEGTSFRMTSKAEGNIQIENDEDFKAFGQEMESFLGLKKGSLSTVDANAQRATKFSSTQVINQTYQGHEVLEATLQITKDKNGEVYMVENLTKPIRNDIHLKIVISKSKAIALIKDYFSNSKIRAIKLLSSEAKIHADRSPQELVWDYLVSTKPIDTFHVFVGASTGKITSFKVNQN